MEMVSRFSERVRAVISSTQISRSMTNTLNRFGATVLLQHLKKVSHLSLRCVCVCKCVVKRKFPLVKSSYESKETKEKKKKIQP